VWVPPKRRYSRSHSAALARLPCESAPVENAVMHLSEAATPSFLVDRQRVERNCARMLDKAQESKVRLRPHVKTHKTIEGEPGTRSG
ncbi:MAG: hypothetical protein ABR524_14540, partial [Thermoanaerobaculia bacterium]